jgi:hypothetical protein
MQSSAFEIHKGACEFHSGELAPVQGVMKLLISAPFRLDQRALSADREWPFSLNWLAGTHKRMKDKAAHACRALRRARVADELQRRRGTRIGEALEAGAQQYRPTPGALSLPEHRFPPSWSVEHRAAAKLLSRDGGLVTGLAILRLVQ